VVAVRRRDGARPFTTHTKNIGLEVGLHGQGSDAAVRETVFGQFEQDWPRLRAKLVGGGALSNDERDLVSLFTAVQWARTRESILRREFVADIAAFTDERPLSQDAVRQYLAERHLGFPPEDAEVEGAWTIANYVIEQEHTPASTR
jgi:hypothetical protein